MKAQQWLGYVRLATTSFAKRSRLGSVLREYTDVATRILMVVNMVSGKEWTSVFEMSLWKT